jgi:ABC-type Mn2+/Zn2+ transport system ATPase subunit
VGDGTPLRIGYVPQRDTVDALFPIPVEEIVMMGRYPSIGLVRRPGREDREVARWCLEQVGLQNLSHRNYTELSGGQRQRVLIARALATQPELLVLDEPTHGMDMPSEHGLLQLVKRLHEERRLGVVLVSHLLGSVAESAERIAIIAAGRIEEGPREEMLTAERLSRLYGMDIRVHDLGGRCAIVPHGDTA